MTWVRVRGPRERVKRARGPGGKERGSKKAKKVKKVRGSKSQRVRTRTLTRTRLASFQFILGFDLRQI